MGCLCCSCITYSALPWRVGVPGQQLVQRPRGQRPSRPGQAVDGCHLSPYFSHVPPSRQAEAVVLQVLFSLVFALSANLLQLVLFEILGVLNYRQAPHLNLFLAVNITVYSDSWGTVALVQLTMDKLAAGHSEPAGPAAGCAALLPQLQTDHRPEYALRRHRCNPSQKLTH